MLNVNKFSSGLKVAPVLNLARCQIFASFCFFGPFLPIFRLLEDQNRCRRHFCTVQDNESAKKVAKRCNKSEMNQMFSTGLNLALALHLIQGAEFIPVLHLARSQLKVMNVPHYFYFASCFFELHLDPQKHLKRLFRNKNP